MAIQMRESIVKIKDGKIDNRGEAVKLFKDLKDGPYIVTIKSIRRRSCQQNKFLHGVVIPLVFEGLKQAGFEDVRDHEDAKMIIKDLFLRREIKNEKTNTSIKVIRKTSELTTVEMLDFIADVQRWSIDYLNTYIPDPGQAMPMFNEPILAHYDQEKQAIIIE
jgi:hypothetical protein